MLTGRQWVSRPITEREWVAGRVQEANLPSLTTPLSLLNPTSHYHHHVSRVASQPAALISSASLVETELGTESVHRTPFHPVDINGDMEMRVLARGSVHHYMTPISNDADLEVPSIMHPATRFPTRWQSLIHSNQHLLEDNFEMQPDRQELPRRREMLSIDEYPGEIRLGVAARMLRTAAAGNPFDMLPSRESTIRENQGMMRTRFF
ncbi:hypothetical protein M433DRAFT_154454 [Acidomyces richmondensis BFW]|nr:MAG: hypothetical protein FE78DRAFT_90547 [Acidomyces sp. 'richmondensis']KYG45506.1 hypothetical protein M433DRAFT_154454 [Acidomyces richmondensis BFW]